MLVPGAVIMFDIAPIAEGMKGLLGTGPLLETVTLF